MWWDDYERFTFTNVIIIIIMGGKMCTDVTSVNNDQQ